MKWLRLVASRYYTDLYTVTVNGSVTKLRALVRTAVHFCNKTTNNKLYSLEQPVQANSWRLHQPQRPRHENVKNTLKKDSFLTFSRLGPHSNFLLFNTLEWRVLLIPPSAAVEVGTAPSTAAGGVHHPTYWSGSRTGKCRRGQWRHTQATMSEERRSSSEFSWH